MDCCKEIILPLIEKSGKSDMEIEKDLHLPRSTIYDWKNGRSKSYKKYISEIAAYFNVSTDYLLGKTKIRNEEEKGDLLKLLEDPLNREIYEKLKALDPEKRKIALAQLDVLAGNYGK